MRLKRDDFIKKGFTDGCLRGRSPVSFSGAGAGVDELFAGTPSLNSVRVALTHAMKKDTHKVMVKDVKCAFLYGEIRCISSCRTLIPGMRMVRWGGRGGN